MKLLPWTIQGANTVEPINRDDAAKITFDKLRNYIHMPNGHTALITNKMCHGLGVNISTTDDVNTFINKWNQVKFKFNINKDKGWISLKQSEVQRYHKAFPVGFFQGSSETGVYEILNKELPKIVGTNIEVSFQNIYQRGVTGKFWEFAKNEALKQGNEGSKDFRSRKFSLAPSGLIAYVYREADINKAFKILVKHYGKQTAEKAWPILPDGSRMRFIPMVSGFVRSTKVRNQLSQRIKWHIIAKALEEVLDLPLNDMFTDHDYFGGKSLSYIMQGILSKETKGVSIFRHVTRKWNSNPEVKEYQITAHHYMRNEANAFLKNMESYLKDNYGEISLKHINQTKRRNTQEIDLFTDDDAIGYLLGMEENDNNEGILEEGFKLIVGENHEAKPSDDSTIHILHASKETLDSDESMKSRMSMSSYSNTSGGSAGSQVQWDPSV